jgi:hypothetical protein
MSKSIKANDEDRKKNYRAMDQDHRSMVAYGMICARTGVAQKFRDRRDRRPKDAKHSWQREEF